MIQDSEDRAKCQGRGNVVGLCCKQMETNNGIRD